VKRILRRVEGQHEGVVQVTDTYAGFYLLKNDPALLPVFLRYLLLLAISPFMNPTANIWGRDIKPE